jgi:hypothetical protein
MQKENVQEGMRTSAVNHVSDMATLAQGDNHYTTGQFNNGESAVDPGYSTQDEEEYHNDPDFFPEPTVGPGQHSGSSDMDTEDDNENPPNTPRFSPNSPPFEPWSDELEASMQSHARYLRETEAAQAANDSNDTHSGDVPLIQALPPAIVQPPALPVHDIFDGIVAPETPDERALLVQRFREEILQEWAEDEGASIGWEGPINAHSVHMEELDQALRVHRNQNGWPHMLMTNIQRHDWDRAANCIYTIVVAGGRIRGSAEELVRRMTGVPRALWEYWANRSRVLRAHIRRYVRAHGTFDYFRVIMWHLLPDRQWLGLWRQRRTSRRG